jgi:hypothetical protein
VTTRARQDKYRWLEPGSPLLWISVLGFLVYVQTMWFELTGWDDRTLLQNIDRLPGGLTGLIQAFKSNAFVSSSGAYFRPILTLSFMANSLLGASGVSCNFLTNIVLHLMVASTLYLVLLELGNSRASAFLFSLIYVLHPALAPAVAWIPGRNDTLLAAFALLSFLFFIRYVRNRTRMSAFWHLLFFTLALFTKETALSLLLIFPLYLLLIARKKLSPPGYLVLLPFWILIICIWAVLRSYAVTPAKFLTLGGMLHSAWSNLPSLIQFLGKAFFPFNLSVLPLARNTSLIWGICAASGLAIALYFSRTKRMDRVIFGVLFFLLFLVPSMILGASTQSVALVQLEHRLYLPLVGLILAVIETDLAKKWYGNSRSAKVAVVLVLLTFAILTVLHSRDFKDEASFWDNALKNSPEASFIHARIAQNLAQDGRQSEAIAEFEKALELNPYEFAALINYSNLEYSRGEYEKAEGLLLRALPEVPGDPDAKAKILDTLERIRDNKRYLSIKKEP